MMADETRPSDGENGRSSAPERLAPREDMAIDKFLAVVYEHDRPSPHFAIGNALDPIPSHPIWAQTQAQACVELLDFSVSMRR